METGYEEFSYYYDELTENVHYADRAVYFNRLIQKHIQSKGNVLLDLACGTGTMTTEMAKLGYDVIGVDYSCGMLCQAMDKKRAAGLDILYVNQDMRALELYGTVDAAICTLDSLNHLENLEEVGEVFARVAAHMEQGGVFVFDMNTLYKHRVMLGENVYVYETEDVYCVWENALQDDKCTVEITLQFFEKENDGRYRRKQERMVERAYTPEQIQEKLKTAGLVTLGIYDSDSEEPLKPDSQRMVVIARKEG